MSTTAETVTMVGTLVTTFKGLADSASGIATLVGPTKGQPELVDSRQRLIAAQNGVLEIQERLAAIITENDELKKEAVRLKAWDAEKVDYKLEALAPSVFAYAYTPAKEPAAPAHYICPRCYEGGKKSILQFDHHGSPALICNTCHSRIPLPLGPTRFAKAQR